MKTIYITSFHGLTSRVLQCGVLDHLLENSATRVVLFVPDFKKAYFEETFGNHSNVVIEGISRSAVPKRAFLFYKLTFLFLDTRTMYLIRRSFRGYRHRYQAVCAGVLARMFGSTRLMRELFRRSSVRFSGKPVFTPYFKQYPPDLVFSTDTKEILDTELLVEAKRQGIRTVGMVRSWDYLTGKGMARVKPDSMVVHNETIKEEAITYADMDREDVAVVGIPHFDPYVSAGRSTREAFFKKIGVDPSKHLLLYVPWGDKFADTDWQFLRILNDAIEAGSVPRDLHILVRVPPGDTMNTKRVPESPHITVESPGTSFKNRHRKANEMSFDDLLHLADLMHHSSVVVSSPSTMVIDACAFDTPVILMAFDGDTKRSYYGGVRHYYDFNHIANLVRQGGASLAKNRTEMIEYINTYLNNPAYNREGREVVRREQCFALDGKSSERLAEVLKRNLA